MELKVVMELAVEAMAAAGVAAYKAEESRTYRGQFHIETLLLKEKAETAIINARELQYKRNWLLTEGVVKGLWVVCAGCGDAYSETPVEDGWGKDRMVERDYWNCSAECRQRWRTKLEKSLSRNSERVEVKWQGGRKSVLTTPGKTLSGLTTGDSRAL